MTTANHDLKHLVMYSKWASAKLLEFALSVPEADVERAIPNSHGGILKTFQHIYYADRVWLARLEQASSMPFEDPGPGPALAPMWQSWWPLLDRLAAFASACNPQEVLRFRRLNGDEAAMPLGDLLRHIVNHGTYHRGQVAAMLKQSGHTPPSTDLLFYYREQQC